MPRIGMARHDKSSFNEGKAVRLLAQVLEQNDTIKTIFKDNDRTPNYDGSMELVEEDGTPIKKFIVQIKKCENLEPNQIGPNKGKYVYPLETNFLHYVKKKVTESPAIYFVVDIATERIFWLYLSDKTLMNLDFEDKERVSYPFAETDIITDIAAFTMQLQRIASERNALFVYKTKEEIAEIQDALDYINGLLLNDFSVIKEQCFPNLWRVGLRCSRNHSMSILSNGAGQSTDKAVSFALYPQVKGELDTGIKDFCFLSNNFFNYTDMSGRTSPMEYARHVVSRIVHDYFENRLPEMKFPEIAQYDQWDYDYWALLNLEPNEYMRQVNSICVKWFDELPDKYHEVYDLLFEKRNQCLAKAVEVVAANLVTNATLDNPSIIGGEFIDEVHGVGIGGFNFGSSDIDDFGGVNTCRGHLFVQHRDSGLGLGAVDANVAEGICRVLLGSGGIGNRHMYSPPNNIVTIGQGPFVLITLYHIEYFELFLIIFLPVIPIFLKIKP